MKYFIIIFLLVFMVGCESLNPCQDMERRRCSCEGELAYQKMNVDFIGDKCNCCALNPVLENNKYVWNETCLGGDVEYETICVW